MTFAVFPTLPGLTLTVLKTPGWKTLIDDAPNEYEVRLPQMNNPVWEWQLIYDFLHDFFWGEFTTVSELRTLMGFFNTAQGSGAAFLFTDPDDNYVGPALNASSDPNTPLAQLQLVSDGVGNYYSPVQRTLDGESWEDITDLNGSIGVWLNGSSAAGGGGKNEWTLLGPGLAIPGFSCMGLYLKWGPGAGSWQSDHAYSLGNEILDPAGHIQEVTTAGTSGADEPTWNDSGSTTPDGTGSLVWTDQGYYPGPAAPVTAQFNFYFRVRFSKDNQDFEKFLIAGATGSWVAGQGGGYWTIGGSSAQNGAGTLKLRTARPPAA